MWRALVRYRGLWKLFFTLFCVVFVQFVLFFPLPEWMIAVGFFVVGVLAYHLIMVVHELVHRTFVPHQGLNEFLGCIIAPLVGLHFGQYRAHHFKHHAAARVADDPDAYIYWPVLQEKTAFRRVMVFLFGSVQEFFQKLANKTFPGSDFGGGRWLAFLIVLGMQAGLFMVFLFAGRPSHYFLFWLLPLVAIGLFLNRLRVLIEHGAAFSLYVRASSPQRTVNVRCNLLERILFAPHHFNYHQVHHDHPQIPYYELPYHFYHHYASQRTNESVSYLALLIKILTVRRAPLAD